MVAPDPFEALASRSWFSLAGHGDISPGRDPRHELKGRRAYWLRSLLAPISSLRWNRFITRFHRRFGASDPAARVLAKPTRAYLRRGLCAPQRVAILIETYEWMARAFHRDFLHRICNGDHLPIITIEARKGSHFTVFCTASINVVLQREGEIGFYIARAAGGLPLCRLAMAFSSLGGRSVLAIGGLQGPQTAHKRDVIDATREMYGLRPKDAVLLAARALAKAVGIDEVHAVSDANHVLNRLQDTAKFSNYDEYWRERGATPGGPFGFAFPPLTTSGGEDENKRGALKRQIVAAAVEFVRAYRSA